MRKKHMNCKVIFCQRMSLVREAFEDCAQKAVSNVLGFLTRTHKFAISFTTKGLIKHQKDDIFSHGTIKRLEKTANHKSAISWLREGIFSADLPSVSMLT